MTTTAEFLELSRVFTEQYVEKQTAAKAADDTQKAKTRKAAVIGVLLLVVLVIVANLVKSGVEAMNERAREARTNAVKAQAALPIALKYQDYEKLKSGVDTPPDIAALLGQTPMQIEQNKDMNGRGLVRMNSSPLNITTFIGEKSASWTNINGLKHVCARGTFRDLRGAYRTGNILVCYNPTQTANDLSEFNFAFE